MNFRMHLRAIWELFFPNLCAICYYHLEEGEKMICLYCQADMPFTDYHTYKNNPLAKQMWGRVWVESAAALLHYQKGGKAQKLIHQIKYKGNKEVGVLAGKMLGSRIFNSRYFKHVQCIIPVPLHPARLKKRGYNQSALISKGIAEVLEIDVLENELIRLASTETQTKKNRLNRFENMVQVFSVKSPLIGRHVLLVDDVITTGATIEACAIKLLEAGALSVSIATLAYTE